MPQQINRVKLIRVVETSYSAVVNILQIGSKIFVFYVFGSLMNPYLDIVVL